jgi:hypothetical protein
MVAAALAAPCQADPPDGGALIGSPRTLDLRLTPGDLDGFKTIARPDFSGRWVLDRRRSDDLKDALRAAAGSDRRGAQDGEGGGAGGSSGRGGGGPGGGGSGGGGSGGGGPGGGGPGGQASQQGGPGGGRGRGNDTRAAESLLSNRLDILHREPLLEIETEQHRKRRLYTDHRGSSVSSMGTLGSMASTARWQGNQLVIKTSSGGGVETIQRLRMLASPRRLELITELPSRDGYGAPVDIKQVFLPDGSPLGGPGPIGGEAQGRPSGKPWGRFDG